jgi:hypothetical protein
MNFLLGVWFALCRAQLSISLPWNFCRPCRQPTRYFLPSVTGMLDHNSETNCLNTFLGLDVITKAKNSERSDLEACEEHLRSLQHYSALPTFVLPTWHLLGDLPSILPHYPQSIPTGRQQIADGANSGVSEYVKQLPLVSSEALISSPPCSSMHAMTTGNTQIE